MVIPAALPFLLSGMKQGWAFAWRSLMAAEIYVTILSGFGLANSCTMAGNSMPWTKSSASSSSSFSSVSRSTNHSSPPLNASCTDDGERSGAELSTFSSAHTWFLRYRSAMNRSPAGWFRHLSIGQKLLISFGLILSLLALSLTALLFYLARINSYVDRHKRITVPAIVTAANMRREAYDIKLALHTDQRIISEASDLSARLEGHLSELSQTLTLYKGTHAARTHPVLYGMLADHHRLDLAEQEDRAIEDIGVALRTLAMHLNRIETAEGDRLMTRVAQGLDQLMDAHTQIDIEMKHEGDRLVGRARLTALLLALLLGLVIAGTYALAATHIARPLTALAATADRVAHHDLSAHSPLAQP